MTRRASSWVESEDVVPTMKRNARGQFVKGAKRAKGAKGTRSASGACADAAKAHGRRAVAAAKKHARNAYEGARRRVGEFVEERRAVAKERAMDRKFAADVHGRWETVISDEFGREVLMRHRTRAGAELFAEFESARKGVPVMVHRVRGAKGARGAGCPTGDGPHHHENLEARVVALETVTAAQSTAIVALADSEARQNALLLGMGRLMSDRWGAKLPSLQAPAAASPGAGRIKKSRARKR